MEQVTFIIPVFNAANHIDACMSSFAHQKGHDFKVVFVDDCSTDNTVELIEKYRGQTPFAFEIHRLNNNSGPGVARNVGVSHSDTEYISFVDVDDSLSPNFCQSLLKEAMSNKNDIVISAAYKKWDNGIIKRHYDVNRFKRYARDKELLVSLLDVGPWGKIIKKSLWCNNTEFPSGMRAEDLASIPVVYLRSKSIGFSEDAIYYYRQTQNSRSRAGGQHYNDIFEAYKVLSSRIDSETLKEYYAVTRIGYGVVMNIIRTGDTTPFPFYRNFLLEKYPHGLKNRCFRLFHWEKKIFVASVYSGFIGLLKLMVRIAK